MFRKDLKKKWPEFFFRMDNERIYIQLWRAEKTVIQTTAIFVDYTVLGNCVHV